MFVLRKSFQKEVHNFYHYGVMVTQLTISLLL